MLHAQEVSAPAALQALQPEWQQLWRRAPNATPFQSPQWLLPWWRHLGRGKLATVAVRSGTHGQLVALAPLYVYTDARCGLRHLFPLGIATSDYLDWLVLPGWEQDALRCLAAHLARHAGDWDLLEWPQLRLAASLLALAAPPGWRSQLDPAEPSPVLMLGPSPSRDAPPIAPAMAANLQYCRRRAARTGALAYETADQQTVAALLEGLARLHRRRWALRGWPGVLDDECVLAWHREAASQLLRAGLLRLYGLRLDGELIAVLYCLTDAEPAHQRRCYYYLGGFEPSRQALSPGTLLVGHAIEQAMEEGAQAFDFLRGGEPYKYRWGAVDQPMCTLRLRREPSEAAHFRGVHEREESF